VRVVTVTQFGGPEVLKVEERRTPQPGPGQVLVEVAAAGVNYMDVVRRKGGFGAVLPFDPGAEGAGTVAAVGPGVTEAQVGDRVAWSHAPASYADRVLVAAEDLVPVPASVALDVAAAVLLQGLTALGLVEVTGPFRPDDSVVVHAAAGGVGLLLVQLLAERGVRVIGTVSSAAKAEAARAAGAADTILYTDVDFAAEVRRLTGGVGAAAVYDAVGRTTLRGSLDSARPGGRVVTYGAASGPAEPLTLADLPPDVFAGRYSMGVHYGPAARRRAAAELFDRVASGRLRVVIGGRYPLARAAEAHEALEGRRSTGKLLLVP
jgi:NADPH2:quinone reductase